jgi:DnaJ family protein C protein 28
MPDIEDQMRKAIENGQFADLAGKGKPLPIDDNPYLDPELRAAHHMLKSSGYTLPWIEKRQKILDDLEQARGALERTWTWRRQALTEGQPPDLADAQWQRAQSVFTAQIESLNKQIFDLNLEVPSERFQLPKINLSREVDRIAAL